MKKLVCIFFLFMLTFNMTFADINEDIEDYIDLVNQGGLNEETYQAYMDKLPEGDVGLALGMFLEARLALDQFDYAHARETLEEALALLEGQGASRLEIELLFYLSEMDMFFFDLTSAVDYSLRMRDLSLSIDYYKGVIEADYNIAFSYIYNYDYDQGTIFASEAFDLSRQHDYQNGLASYYGFLGDFDYYYGSDADYISKYEQALDKVDKDEAIIVVESPHQRYRRILAYEYMVNDREQESLDMIMDLYDSLDPRDTYGLYIVEELLGDLYVIDQADRALGHYLSAYEYYLMSSIPENSYPFELSVVRSLGDLYYDKGDFQLAADYYYQVLSYDYKDDTLEFGHMVEELDQIKYDEINSKVNLLEQLNQANAERVALSKRLVLILTIGILILLVAIVLIIFEIRAKSVTEKELYFASITDSLTQVYNRGKIIDLFKENLTSSNAVLLMDIDNFKEINDKHGHIVGDEVLVTMTDIVKGSIREGDAMGRYGGEEFLVILQNITQEEMNEVAERIRANVEGHSWPYDDMVVTVSIGLTSCFSNDPEEVLHEADTLMYQAKNTGKNRIVLGH